MKSWAERLAAPAEPLVRPAPRRFGGMEPGDAMLVPSARQVDNFIRTLPAGTRMSVVDLRLALAGLNGAQGTCPVTIGYHLRTVAEAAFEAHRQGVPLAAITPFWRVLDETSPTTGRLACGVDFVTTRRGEETA